MLIHNYPTRLVFTDSAQQKAKKRNSIMADPSRPVVLIPPQLLFEEDDAVLQGVILTHS